MEIPIEFKSPDNKEVLREIRHIEDMLDERDKRKGYVSLNGKRNIVLWGGGGVLATSLASILTFWFGFYPTIATQDWVERKVDLQMKLAPITREAELRIAPLENNMKQVLEDMRTVNNTMHRMEAKIDLLFPSRSLGSSGPVK